MRTPFLTAVLVSAVAAPAWAADQYSVDANHSAVTFKVSHLGLSWTHGRFKDFAGSFTLDPASPANISFSLTIKADSIDTDIAKRDEHLRSPDFFNTKQFPEITFQSTAVHPVADGYQVTGNFSMHGVTQPVSFTLVGGRAAEFPKGVQRIGFSTDLVLKRSAYGIDKFLEAIGDDVHIAISFEGTKK